jgi:hypothetical protein
MRESTHTNWLTRSGRVRALTVAALASGILVAGCGASSPSSTTRMTIATADSASGMTSTVAAGAGAAGSGSTAPGSTAPGASQSGLAFSRCMRTNGVPNFPDPQPGGGLLFNVAGINPSAPAVREARAKCQKFLPAGGPPQPGATTHPSAQTLAKLLKLAVCMHQHGISQFPEPRTSVPSDPFGGGTGVITDYDGVILLFPSTLDIQAPAYTQAAAACGPLAQKLARGPHG